MGTNYTLNIAGSPVNVVQGTLDVINQIGQRSTGTVQTWSAPGVVYLRGTQVQLFDQNSNLIYSGYVAKDKVTKESRQGHGYLEHQITLMDNCYLADKRLVFRSFTQVGCGTIFRDIVLQYLSAEGVTYTPSSVAGGVVIDSVTWNGKQISTAFQWLATVSGYWWNIDVNKVAWFLPYSGAPAPFVLDGTTVAVDSNLAVTYGNDQYVNRQWVIGGYAETGLVTFNDTGNGHTNAWALPYEIASTAAKDLSITVDGVPQTIGVKGATNYQFYAAVGDSVIAQDTNLTPLTSSDSLQVIFKGRYPLLAEAQNQALIAAQRTREGGGTGVVESSYTNKKIYNQYRAFQDAGALLSHYAADMTQIDVNVLASQSVGILEGQMLTVNLSDFALNNAQMLVNQVEYTDSVDENFNIYTHITAIGSPYETAQWQTLWQGLMNQTADATDLSSQDDAVLVGQLFDTQITLSPTVVVHPTTTVCPICNTGTICGASSPVIC